MKYSEGLFFVTLVHKQRLLKWWQYGRRTVNTVEHIGSFQKENAERVLVSSCPIIRSTQTKSPIPIKLYYSIKVGVVPTKLTGTFLIFVLFGSF